MKINKRISKLLILTLLISNFNIYPSLANDNNETIENRYETLEGEYITINDSKEGEVKSIEILGNTVQDPDNLENIQSVGDLYVDDDGNPILDSLGRKQYKIPVLSTGKNLFNLNKVVDLHNDIQLKDDIITLDGKVRDITSITKFKPNIEYTLTYDRKVISGNGAIGFRVYYTDGSNEHLIGSSVFSSLNFTFGKNKTVSRFEFTFSNTCTYELSNIQLEEGTQATPYEPYQEDKLTILSPTPLEKVGDVADRIICKDGVWGVEKNVLTAIYDGSDDENWVFSTARENTLRFINLDKIHKNVNPYYLMCNRFVPTTLAYDNDIEGFEVIGGGSPYYSCICIEKAKLSTQDLNGFKQWLNDNQVIVKYIATQPTFIPLPHSKQIKLRTFANKTNIFSQTENGINPTIKVTIDRLPNLCEEAIEDVIVNPTTEKLTYARSLVNQMDEGDLKNELQQRLNEISNLNDLQLEKKKSTSNVDVYIKSENSLHMALSTNQITFEDYSGLTEVEKDNAITISINSSLPYELNAYMLDEMYNSNKSQKIDMDRLNVRDNLNTVDTEYKEFVAVGAKLTLNDSCNAGNGIRHNIDLKLVGDEAYPADIYKTVIKFESQQK